MKWIWGPSRLSRIETKVDLILSQIKALQGMEEQEMADLTALTAQVTENTEVEASAITLLNQLSDLIRQNMTDPAALQALADQLNGSADALAAAIVANTPQG